MASEDQSLYVFDAELSLPEHGPAMSFKFARATSAAAVLTAGVLMNSALAQGEARFGTRPPRVCSELKAKPSPDQAASLIQCHQESETEREIVLLENVRVQMGGGQPYDFHAHSRLTAVDTTSLVYPIRGSFTWYDCSAISVIPIIHSDNRGKNCFYSAKPSAAGFCWSTTFGNWDCSMIDIDHNDIVQDQPPPT